MDCFELKQYLNYLMNNYSSFGCIERNPICLGVCVCVLYSDPEPDLLCLAGEPDRLLLPLRLRLRDRDRDRDREPNNRT